MLQHHMDPGRDHAIDLRYGVCQFFAQCVDQLGTLLSRRRHQTVALEHLAHAGEGLLRQAGLLQDRHGLGKALLRHVDGEASVFLHHPFGGDALVQQGGDHGVGFALAEVGVQLGLATLHQAGEQHDGEQTARRAEQGRRWQKVHH